jgi:hypothetical protein
MSARRRAIGGPVGNLDPIRLPRPERDGGKSVLASLWARRTEREISPKKLPLQTLSNLLWAAEGVNRKRAAFDRTGRTAGSASNSQEINLYVAMPEGVFLYQAQTHQLTPVAAGDFRPLSSRNGSTSAPVHIFYVVDVSRFWKGPGQPDPHIGDPEVQKSYYYVDTGLIAQNVALFAASQGLAAWFHNCHAETAHHAFKLKPNQRVLFAQSVGMKGRRSGARAPAASARGHRRAPR